MTGDDTAKVVGNVGLIGDISSICTVFFFGYAVELVGRKKMLVGGLLVTGTAIICKPLPNNLTGLYILSVISSISVIPVLYTPYTVDYVQKCSLGLITGYYNVLSQFATLISTSGAIQVQKVLGVSVVYYGIGGFCVVVACFLLFGINDVHNNNGPPQVREEEVLEDAAA